MTTDHVLRGLSVCVRVPGYKCNLFSYTARFVRVRTGAGAARIISDLELGVCPCAYGCRRRPDHL
jgi:hypothetical protein